MGKKGKKGAKPAEPETEKADKQSILESFLERLVEELKRARIHDIVHVQSKTPLISIMLDMFELDGVRQLILDDDGRLEVYKDIFYYSVWTTPLSSRWSCKPVKFHLTAAALRSIRNERIDVQTDVTARILYMSMGYAKDCTMALHGPVPFSSAYTVPVKGGLVLVAYFAIIPVISNETTFHADHLRIPEYTYQMVVEKVVKPGAVEGLLKKISGDLKAIGAVDVDAYDVVPRAVQGQAGGYSGPYFDVYDVVIKGSVKREMMEKVVLAKKEAVRQAVEAGEKPEDHAVHASDVIGSGVVGTGEPLPAQVAANELVLSQLTQEDNIVKLLDQAGVPFRLSEAERAVVVDGKNVLLIGRSGTGKTTCAVLRMWSRFVAYNSLEGRKKGLLANSQVPVSALAAGAAGERVPASGGEGGGEEDLVGYHPVFVTLSPVLANQVRRYYRKLTTGLEAAAVQGKTGEDGPSDSRAMFRPVTTTVDGTVPSDHVYEADGEAVSESDHDSDEDEEAVGNGLTAFTDVPDNEFPLFLTLRKFLLMLDTTLRKPFYRRNADGEAASGGRQAWHVDGGQGLTRITPKLKTAGSDDDDDDDDSNDGDDDNSGVGEEESDGEDRGESVRKAENEGGRGAPGGKKDKGHSLDQLIDFDYFSKVMWPKFGGGSGLHPSLVYTEINSFIKGSAEALDTKNGFLGEKEYVEIGQKRAPMPASARPKVYALFRQYNAALQNAGRHDLQDVVFHIYSRLKREGYNGIPIHAINLDEVQDMTQATLRLFFMVCRQPTGFFFCGDTCQTITRGIGFRFADLRSLFHHEAQVVMNGFSVPDVLQLTKNYRSHAGLVNFSEGVVALLEQLFPSTVDKLDRDTGAADGPLPAVLAAASPDDLFALLSGGAAQGGGPIDFGASQAIIVRSQEAKAALPPELRHALCMTVYEAKGLEFDDVLLYDFFADSPASSAEWDVAAASATNVDLYASKDGENAALTALEESLADVPSEGQGSGPFSALRHGLLCTELKQLYTAATRARHRLFIYDSSPRRAAFYRLWVRAGLATVIRPGQLVSGIVRTTSAEEWVAQGWTMLRNRFYKQAKKCFGFAEDDRMQAFSGCMVDAEAANEKAMIAQDDVTKHAEDPFKGGSSAFAQAQKNLEAAKGQFAAVGAAFLEVAQEEEAAADARARVVRKARLQAARCLFSADRYEQAADLFASLGRLVDAGQAYQSVGRKEMHGKAAEMFVQAARYHDALRAYDAADMPLEAFKLVTGSDAVKEALGKEAAVRFADRAIAAVMYSGDSPLAGDVDALLSSKVNKSKKSKKGKEAAAASLPQMAEVAAVVKAAVDGRLWARADGVLCGADGGEGADDVAADLMAAGLLDAALAVAVAAATRGQALGGAVVRRMADEAVFLSSRMRLPAKKRGKDVRRFHEERTRLALALLPADQGAAVLKKFGFDLRAAEVLAKYANDPAKVAAAVLAHSFDYGAAANLLEGDTTGVYAEVMVAWALFAVEEAMAAAPHGATHDSAHVDKQEEREGKDVEEARCILDRAKNAVAGASDIGPAGVVAGVALAEALISNTTKGLKAWLAAYPSAATAAPARYFSALAAVCALQSFPVPRTSVPPASPASSTGASPGGSGKKNKKKKKAAEGGGSGGAAAGGGGGGGGISATPRLPPSPDAVLQLVEAAHAAEVAMAAATTGRGGGGGGGTGRRRAVEGKDRRWVASLEEAYGVRVDGMGAHVGGAVAKAGGVEGRMPRAAAYSLLMKFLQGKVHAAVARYCKGVEDMVAPADIGMDGLPAGVAEAWARGRAGQAVVSAAFVRLLTKSRDVARSTVTKWRQAMRNYVLKTLVHVPLVPLPSARPALPPLVVDAAVEMAAARWAALGDGASLSSLPAVLVTVIYVLGKVGRLDLLPEVCGKRPPGVPESGDVWDDDEACDDAEDDGNGDDGYGDDGYGDDGYGDNGDDGYGDDGFDDYEEPTVGRAGGDNFFRPTGRRNRRGAGTATQAKAPVTRTKGGLSSAELCRLAGAVDLAVLAARHWMGGDAIAFADVLMRLLYAVGDAGCMRSVELGMVAEIVRGATDVLLAVSPRLPGGPVACLLPRFAAVLQGENVSEASVASDDDERFSRVQKVLGECVDWVLYLLENQKGRGTLDSTLLLATGLSALADGDHGPGLAASEEQAQRWADLREEDALGPCVPLVTVLDVWLGEEDPMPALKKASASLGAGDMVALPRLARGNRMPVQEEARARAGRTIASWARAAIRQRTPATPHQAGASFAAFDAAADRGATDDDVDGWTLVEATGLEGCAADDAMAETLFNYRSTLSELLRDPMRSHANGSGALSVAHMHRISAALGDLATGGEAQRDGIEALVREVTAPKAKPKETSAQWRKRQLCTWRAAEQKKKRGAKKQELLQKKKERLNRMKGRRGAANEAAAAAVRSAAVGEAGGGQRSRR